MAWLLPVELVACNLPRPPNFPKHVLPDYLAGLDVPHRIEYRDTYSIVKEKVPEGATYCSRVFTPASRKSLSDCAEEKGAMPWCWGTIGMIFLKHFS